MPVTGHTVTQRVYDLTPDTGDHISLEELYGAIEAAKRHYHRDAQILATGDWLEIRPTSKGLRLSYTVSLDAQNDDTKESPQGEQLTFAFIDATGQPVASPVFGAQKA